MNKYCGTNKCFRYKCTNTTGDIAGASFQLFLGGPNFFIFLNADSIEKLEKNSTLAVWRGLAVWRCVMVISPRNRS